MLLGTSQPGVPKQEGDGGYIPPIIWMYTPNILRMVHICIPPNNLNGCTSERKFGEKNVLFLLKTFFLVFTWIWGKKCFVCFFLVFTKFSHLNKIVVEVHPPMLKLGQNWGKIANYPPQCSTKIDTTDLSHSLLVARWSNRWPYHIVCRQNPAQGEKRLIYLDDYC